MTKSGTFQIVEENFRGIQKELVRKSIHLMVAAVPMMASINIQITVGLLTAGILIYSYSEMLRCSGRPVYIISKITMIASRDRDSHKFVLGPITLGLGALLALILYPNPAATIGIYALAFGDGLSSVVGKIWGKIEIPFTGGKTFAGSFSCLLAVYFASLAVSGRPLESCLIAIFASTIEVLPLKDYDNLLIPVLVASMAQQLLT